MKDDNQHYKRVEAMLYNYKKTKIEIKNLQLDLELLKSEYDGITAIGYEEKTGATNKFNSSVENEVVSRDNKLKRITALIKFKQIEIQKIDNILDEMLDERDKYLITEYYFNKNQLKNISRHINLEESYLSTYKSNLIKNICDIIFVQ